MKKPIKTATKQPLAPKNALRLDTNQGGTDYVMHPKHPGCWITVDNLTVHIARHISGEGVEVRLYPLGDEMADPIDTAFATYASGAQAAPV